MKLPVVREAEPFAKALGTQSETRLFLDEDAVAEPILKVLAGRSGEHVALMVGPEGGWTDGERNQAVEAGWIACSLGTTILRAETAGISGLAVVRAWLGNRRPG